MNHVRLVEICSIANTISGGRYLNSTEDENAGVYERGEWDRKKTRHIGGKQTTAQKKTSETKTEITVELDSRWMTNKQANGQGDKRTSRQADRQRIYEECAIGKGKHAKCQVLDAQGQMTS